jgi:hypothetical protein
LVFRYVGNPKSVDLVVPFNRRFHFYVREVRLYILCVRSDRWDMRRACPFG